MHPSVIFGVCLYTKVAYILNRTLGMAQRVLCGVCAAPQGAAHGVDERTNECCVVRELLIKNVRPLGGAVCDVWIRQGHIYRMGADLQVGQHVPVEDGGGAIALPGLIEAHTHLDKSHWGQAWYTHTAGEQLLDRIDNERRWRAQAQLDPYAQTMALARAFVASGTTRLRTHVDIDTEAGLHYLHSVLKAKAAMADVLEMQVVAFPQSGLLRRPGTVALMDAAMQAGADVVGGLDPVGIDGDRDASLDALFGIAQRCGKPLDIHLHEAAQIGAQSLSAILDRVQAQGLQGRVMISHAFCVGDVSAQERSALLARMAALQVSIATSGTASRPIPQVLECHHAGVLLAGGNDGIRDTWSPYGSPDMLERAMLIGWRNDLRRDVDVALALKTVTDNAALACGFVDYGLAQGCRADVVLVQGQSLAEVVVARPVRQCVISGGVVVARQGHWLPSVG